jgi:myo-inositol 2-dehydrogenase / D-chiro-inositol 1-dehydrogenase
MRIMRRVRRSMTNHKRLRVALFGAGRIGNLHARNIASHPDLQLVWVCDPFLEAARSLADRSGAQVTSVEEIFDDESIDAVVIGSPTDTHIDLIARARSHGKAALCEKPIDLDIRRVEEYQDIINCGVPA